MRAMTRLQVRIGVIACVFSLAAIATCEETPQPVTVCELKSDPAAYNHKLVEITGFISHGFEDFTLFDPTCPSWPGVWLEYGGKRSREPKVEDIPIPLADNEQFRQFDKLINPPFRSGAHGSVVHATLSGRFFSGRQMKYPKGTFWGGYGHLGCCTLLAIQGVKSVDPQNRNDVDYGEVYDQPDIVRAGCGFRVLTPIDPLKAQQQADLDPHDWIFDDPERVASEALARFANVETSSVALKEKRKWQGRHVYEWKPVGKADTYMVVVSRPYELSFYARDPKRVAWVVAAAYVSSCGKKNSVTRIK
jgi:hypothetical protein